MTSLELIVRPFQTKDVTPPKRIVGAEKVVDPVHVAIGSGGGTALMFRAISQLDYKVEDAFTYREVSRKTHTKRIENPDDPSQFLEVERIDQISLRHKLKPDDKRIYEFKNSD